MVTRKHEIKISIHTFDKTDKSLKKNKKYKVNGAVMPSAAGTHRSEQLANAN